MTVTNAPVTASSAGNSQNSGAKAASGMPAAEKAADKQADPDKAPLSAAAQEKVKIYIYPSDKNGNTPVQDGSITAGSLQQQRTTS